MTRRTTVSDADYQAHLDECLGAARISVGDPAGRSISRRSVIATMGGLFLLGFGDGCGQPGFADADTSEGASTETGYGPFLTAYRAAPDVMDSTKNPDAQPPWKAVIAGTWLKKDPYVMFAELRERCPILVTPGFPTIVTSYADCQRILHRNKFENGVYTSAPNTDFVVRHNSDTMEATAGKPAAMLGQVDIALHDLDKEIQMRGMGIPDEKKTRSMVRKHVEKLLGEHANKPSGQLDIVKTLTRWIAVHVAKDFFGVPSGEGAFVEITDLKLVTYDYDYAKKDYLEPKPYARVREIAKSHADIFGKKIGDRVSVSEADIYEWVSDVFQTWFLNLRDPSIPVRKRGIESGNKLLAYLQYLVKKAFETPPASEPNDMLGRMVWLYRNDAGLRQKLISYYRDEVAPAGTMSENDFVIQRIANCVGSVGGSIVNIERFVTNIMEVLLREKNAEHLSRAAATARAWKEKGDDNARAEIDILCKYMLEAQRFRPQNDALARAVVTDQIFESPIPLLDGRTTVKVQASVDIDNTRQRTLILAATASANMDPSKFPRPEEIIITNDRSIRDEAAYLHLGGTFARHECLGKFLVSIEATECMRGLLLLGDLKVKEALKNGDEIHPTDPLKGRPYPESFVLSFRKG